MISSKISDITKEAQRIIDLGFKVEVKQFKDVRTNLQNRALHLYFTLVSNELNQLGITYEWKGLKGSIMETAWTPELVKEFIWRPIQVSMFNIKSTTKIKTGQINQIIDVINKFFGERGVVVSFPNQFEKYIEMLNKTN